MTTDGSFMSEPLYLLLVLGAVHLAVTLRDRVDVARARRYRRPHRPRRAHAQRGPAAHPVRRGAGDRARTGRPPTRPAERRDGRGRAGAGAAAVAPAQRQHVQRAGALLGELRHRGGGHRVRPAFLRARDRALDVRVPGAAGPEAVARRGGALCSPPPERHRLHARATCLSVPRVVAVRELRTWGLWAPRQQAAFEAPEGRVEGWQLAAWAMYLVVVALAIAGAVIARRRRLPLWPLAGMIAMVVVSTALTYGNQRFRVTAHSRSGPRGCGDGGPSGSDAVGVWACRGSGEISMVPGLLDVAGPAGLLPPARLGSHLGPGSACRACNSPHEHEPTSRRSQPPAHFWVRRGLPSVDQHTRAALSSTSSGAIR